MAVELQIEPFLALEGPIFDVRSPCEYRRGHLPRAVNLPLFSDEERAVVGTLYKQKGSDAAIMEGLNIVGPKLPALVAEAKGGEPGVRRIHCWRGGMRSRCVASLLEAIGVQAVTLKGGYKRYRRWVLESFDLPRPLIAIGGMTGVGKSALLEALKRRGEQVLDLEALANHRGSSFGAIGQPPQPTNEQFENLLAEQWAYFDPERVVWIEDESRTIGGCTLPSPLFAQLQRAPLFFIERPIGERVALLAGHYGSAEGKDALIDATKRLEKKLGGVRAKEAISLIKEERFEEAAALLLGYYDKSYGHCLARRKRSIEQRFFAGGVSAEELAETFLAQTAPSGSITSAVAAFKA